MTGKWKDTAKQLQAVQKERDDHKVALQSKEAEHGAQLAQKTMEMGEMKKAWSEAVNKCKELQIRHDNEKRKYAQLRASKSQAAGLTPAEMPPTLRPADSIHSRAKQSIALHSVASHSIA